MSSTFEKRYERLQNKVQVKINLANDEIDRLRSDYAIIQGQICEVTDQLNKLTNYLTQIKHFQIGVNRRKQVSIDTMISKMKKEYILQLQEIETFHSQLINDLNKDYENSMKEIERQSNANLEQQINPINKAIEDTKEDLKRLKYDYKVVSSSNKSFNSNSFVDDEFRSSHDEEVENIRKLEKKIQKQNQERLNSILQGKTKLQECVETIEQMDKNHNSEMENYRAKLDALDKMYQDKIRIKSENHHKTIEKLTRKLSEYNEKITSIQNVIQKVQNHHKTQIDKAIAEGDSLSFQISEKAKQYSASFSGININTSKYQSNISDSIDYSDTNNEKSRLIKLKERLEKCENELHHERTENESLKREIARLKHEEKMSPRIKKWKSSSLS